MTGRIIRTITLLTLGLILGGWWGMFGALLIVGFLGFLHPYSKPLHGAGSESDAEVTVEQARRGANLHGDPTRPDDEHPFLLTHEIRALERRKR